MNTENWPDEAKLIYTIACEAGMDQHTAITNLKAVSKIIDSVALTEREACAQVCDVIAEKDDWEGTADVCAKAIRARGNNETE